MGETHAARHRRPTAAHCRGRPPRRYIPGDIDLLLGNVDLDRGYQLTDAGHRFDGRQKTAVCSVRLVLVKPGQLQGTGLPWRQGTGPVRLERGQVVEANAANQHTFQRRAGPFLAKVRAKIRGLLPEEFPRPRRHVDQDGGLGIGGKVADGLRHLRDFPEHLTQHIEGLGVAGIGFSDGR